jgi:hypothetical protein
LGLFEEIVTSNETISIVSTLIGKQMPWYCRHIHNSVR